MKLELVKRQLIMFKRGISTWAECENEVGKFPLEVVFCLDGKIPDVKLVWLCSVSEQSNIEKLRTVNGYLRAIRDVKMANTSDLIVEVEDMIYAQQ